MKKLLVVVDYQKDFVDGALGFEGAEGLDSKIAAKIRKYAADPDGAVCCTLDTHFDNYLETREGRNLPVVHCIKGTPGHELYGETAKAAAEAKAPAFEKNSFGLVITPEIAAKLPAKDDVASVELCGLVSNICVISNAVVFSAYYTEADIIVDAECTASHDPAMNDKCLDILSGIQVKVINR
ncbi:MAG: cysteine hydrolase family protein [Huintestinicola sp.]